MMEVAGQFFIVHQLRYIRQQGISEVVLCLGHMGEQIKAIVNDGSAYLETIMGWTPAM